MMTDVLLALMAIEIPVVGFVLLRQGSSVAMTPEGEERTR
jgi:hypothetical protein